MTTLPPRPGARQSMSEVRRREAAFLRSVSGRPQAVENLWLKLWRIFLFKILQKLSEMSPRINLIRTRWKRDNIFGQTQKKIQKEIHLVSNKTGVNPWVVLGIQYWVVTLKSSMRAIKVKDLSKPFTKTSTVSPSVLQQLNFQQKNKMCNAQSCVCIGFRPVTFK